MSSAALLLLSVLVCLLGLDVVSAEVLVELVTQVVAGDDCTAMLESGLGGQVEGVPALQQIVLL